MRGSDGCQFILARDDEYMILYIGYVTVIMYVEVARASVSAPP